MSNKKIKKSSAALSSNENDSYDSSSLIESAEDAIITKTLDGIITSWNKGAERIFGYAAEEVIGKSILIIIPPERHDEELYILSKIRAGERVELYDTARVRKDGSLIDVSLAISPIKDANGEIIGASKVAREVTHLKNAEEQFRMSEERYRTLFNSIDEGFCVIELIYDQSGKPFDWRFLEVNPAFEKHNGLYNAVGKTIRELTPDIEERWFEIYGEVASTGKPVRFEEGSQALQRWFNVYAFRIGEEDSRKIAVLFNDITKRRRAEEELRESQEMLRLAMSSSRMGAWSRDLIKDEVEWSAELEAIFGLPHGTFSGTIEGFYDYVYEPDRERIRSEIWKALDEQKDYTVEFRFHHADGSLRWMEGRGRAVYAPDGKPTKVYGIGIDVTERKRAEEELRKSDARLRLALGIAQTSTFEIDLITDTVQTDEIGREIYGFEKDEPLTFTKVQSHFHPDDYDEVLQKVSLAFAPTGSDEFEVEQRIIRTNGEIRWIRVRGRAFFEGKGEGRRAVTCLGTYIDITKQKEAEQERERLLEQLEAERAKLAYLFIKAPAFVAALRGPEHIFELTNPTYLQLIGHRDVIGKPVREALPEIEGQGFFELLDDVYQTGEPYTGSEIPVLIQQEPSGPLKQHFVNFVFQPIFEADGSVSGIFAHGVDVTEQVRARQEAEEANRAKDEFLATLSHELRTPLNAILGWSRMLTEGRLDDEVKARALETIQRNALIQAELIDDILDVSRIISGKLKLEVGPIELSSVIESAVESVLPAAEAKDIRIQRVLDYGNSMVSGDPNRLQQVIWNLLSNAVKFTPKGGRVQIRLERVNSHVEIIVTDTGIGISPDVLPYIFDRFRQADSATTRQHGGLGLGLAIVRHLVEMHGGTVEAESGGEGQGSTFTVKLPLIALRSIDALPKEDKRVHPTLGSNVSFECSPELEGLHVLVVDDEEDGRTLVAMVLEKCGAQVTEVSSAADGFKALQKLKPDVLISDLGMPGEDGYSLIKKVRALPPEQGGQIPAAALTAYARLEDRMRVLRSGFQIHIPKPVEPAELIAVVANLSGRHQEL